MPPNAVIITPKDRGYDQAYTIASKKINELPIPTLYRVRDEGKVEVLLGLRLVWVELDEQLKQLVSNRIKQQEEDLHKKYRQINKYAYDNANEITEAKEAKRQSPHAFKAGDPNKWYNRVYESVRGAVG